MKLTNYRTLAAALVLAGGFGLVGHPSAVYAGATLAECAADPMMAGDSMKIDPMMADHSMDMSMGDMSMGDMSMGDSMMMDHSMDVGMMASMMMRAKDGQCLASESAQVQAAFTAAWGDGAGARWVQEHEAELARKGM
jgi:hypothetical protein